MWRFRGARGSRASRSAVHGWGLRVAAGALLVCGLAGATEAQVRRAAPPTASPSDEALAEGTSPAEIQRLFDAYFLVQAQEALKLTDAQLPEFLTRLRALQDTRRRAQAERARVIADLRRLADDGRNGAPARERIGERIRALRDVETRSLSEILQAVDRLDEILEPVQQARLRVLEEQMERRKLELLVRARQAARARRGR